MTIQEDCGQMLWEPSEGSNHYRLWLWKSSYSEDVLGRDLKGFRVELEERKAFLMGQVV